jgi:hypothetical protein
MNLNPVLDTNLFFIHSDPSYFEHYFGALLLDSILIAIKSMINTL